MARRYYSSTAARTTLATGVDDTTTTLSVTAVSGWPSSFPYTLIIDADTVNEEIVEVSARSGTTLTVTRGVDGTSAVAHSSGAAVQHGVSARDFDEPNAFINGTGTVTETLLASNAVTSAKILDGTIVNADINASAAIAQSKIANLTSDLASKVDYALPVNAQTGTTYTFVAADAEKLTTASNAAAVTLTIPPQSSVTWSDNTVLRVVNYGAGAVTIDGGSGVTVTNTSSTVAQYGAAVAIRTGSDAWTVVPFGGGDVPAATVSSPAATGQYTDGGGQTWDYWVFNSSSTLVVDTAGLADVLVVAGGGGGSGGGGYGGGGAGGYRLMTDVYLSGSMTVTVGAGGSGAGSGNRGGNGNRSRLGQYTVPQGGAGGGDGSNDTTKLDSGQTGGSGGGGGETGGGSLGRVQDFGNVGGSGSGSCGGGGGGAGGTGANASGPSGNGGAGGAGTSSDITGTSVGRAGGGGGGSRFGTAGSASDGGGAGSVSSNGSNGSANTGGGGGGGGVSNTGGNGGSGVVIVRVRT